MNFQETIETISKRKMTEQEAFEFCRDQWGMVCSWLKSRLDFGTILIERNKGIRQRNY